MTSRWQRDWTLEDLAADEAFDNRNLHEELLLDAPRSAASMRELVIGRTYLVPTENIEVVPGSGHLVPVAKIRLLGVIDRGHPVINAVVVRTGAQTWTLTGEEWTGTEDQPAVTWLLDMDPAWPDHTAIGGSPGTSFTSLVFDLRKEIGDASVFGSRTIVGHIQEAEKAMDAISRRVAVLESAGGSTHGHVDVAADITLPVNNQGPGYVIITDDKSLPAHIGLDLLDGNEHKISLAWKAGFDPTHFEDPPGTVNDWDARPGSVWFTSGSLFKRLVDPVTGAVISYAAVKLFVDGGSVLTVKWNATLEQMEIIKVAHGTAHTA